MADLTATVIVYTEPSIDVGGALKQYPMRRRRTHAHESPPSRALTPNPSPGGRGWPEAG
jgi:hypothetical protein